MSEWMDGTLSAASDGRLRMGGLAVSDLAKEYGTPLYLLSDDAVIANSRAFADTLKAHYPGPSRIAFASKALDCTHIYRVMREQGIGADVVSAGELYTARRAGMPPEDLIFHGNNKTLSELTYALDERVGCIVVDNQEELRTLGELCEKRRQKATIALRLKPGVEAHTHEFIRTGGVDSKFGFDLEPAKQAARDAMGMPGLELTGVHCHIGSQIFEAEPFALAVKVLMRFMRELSDETGHTLTDLNLGGGYGVRYTGADRPRAISEAARATALAVAETAAELGYPLPRLILEPGRSLVAAAGLTVYTVGCVKDIPGVRTYVSVDGGMGDNPRYTLYGALYDALLADRALEPRTKTVTVSGRCCETDTLIPGVALPDGVKAGDFLAVLCTGAYNYALASNYNRVPRPPIVAVRDGKAKLVVRRETLEDLVKCDL